MLVFRSISISAVLIWLVAGCASTPTLKPVVKPSGPEWAALAAAKQRLASAQLDLKQKQQSLAVANTLASSFQTGQSVYKPIFEQFLPDKNKAGFQSATNAASAKFAGNLTQAKADADQASQSVADAKQGVADEEAKVDAKTRTDFENKFTDLLSSCQKIVDKYQGRSRAGAKTAFWLQMGGLVAGAVAAPALVAASSVGNRAWIAGVSGFAGGTNLAESSLGSANLNGVSDATTANQIVSQVRTDIQNAQAKTSWDDRYDALAAVQTDCTLIQMGVPTAMPANGLGGGQQTGQQQPSGTTPTATTPPPTPAN